MESDQITVTIKDLKGKDFQVKIAKTATVLDLKNENSKHCEVPAEGQKIIFRGKILKDTDTLAGALIQDGCSVHMVIIQPFAPLCLITPLFRSNPKELCRKSPNPSHLKHNSNNSHSRFLKCKQVVLV